MNHKRLARYPTIADCRRGAGRRLPRFLFDFLEGGTDREVAIARNCEAFDRIVILPRVGRAVTLPDLTGEVLGRRWKLPFGVCPCGYVDMLDPGTELATAQAAERRGAPFIASISTITPLEQLARSAPNSMWQQVQQSTDPAIASDIVRRAWAANIQVLVVTMDIPMTSKRVRDLRNGFTLPLRPKLKLVLDLMGSPRWVLSSARRPDPKPGNFMKYLPDGVTSTAAAVRLEEQTNTVTTWADFERFRAQWPGSIVAKGILNPADACRAVELGADAIIVSNHGGRQFDGAPATIDCLAAVVQAVRDRIPVFIDSGIRSGLDVMRALSLGARLAFSGRSFYYAAGAMGRSGGEHAFDLITDELVISMRQAGFRSIGEIAAYNRSSVDQ